MFYTAIRCIIAQSRVFKFRLLFLCNPIANRVSGSYVRRASYAGVRRDCVFLLRVLVGDSSRTQCGRPRDDAHGYIIRVHQWRLLHACYYFIRSLNPASTSRATTGLVGPYSQNSAVSVSFDTRIFFVYIRYRIIFIIDWFTIVIVLYYRYGVNSLLFLLLLSSFYYYY